MDDEPLTPTHELSSELTGLNKGQSELKKKQLIIGIAAGSLLAVLIIIIIIVASTTSSNKKSSPKIIGEINLIYDVSNTFDAIEILGKEYKKDPSDFDIYINNTKIKYTKEYKFEKVGINNVTIKLYTDLNMDYMFKGVEDLMEVEMHSDGKCKITSMKM